MYLYIGEFMKKIRKLNKRKESVAELFKLFAKVDPDYLKSFSKMVNKNLDLDECKDTEDYNLSIFSKLVDGAAHMFMEAGQKDLDLGEGLHMESRLKLHHGQNLEIKDFEDALIDGDYRKYPFSFNVEQELRAKFLLQTQASDDFGDLLQDTLKLMSQYISSDNISLLNRVIARARKRVLKEDLIYLSPHKDHVKGKYRKLDSEELKKYKLKSYKKESIDGEVVDTPEDIFIDERKWAEE